MPIKTNKLPKQKDLREDFTYNPLTGSFIRYDSKFGCISRGYWRIEYNDKAYMVHRLIWKWWYGYDPEEVDHINGDKLDNRIDNLRNVDRSTNCRNSAKSVNNTSGFNGVSWHYRLEKWVARVTIKTRRKHIGYYSNIQEAKDARDKFIKTFYPDYYSERHGT